MIETESSDSFPPHGNSKELLLATFDASRPTRYRLSDHHCFTHDEFQSHLSKLEIALPKVDTVISTKKDQYINQVSTAVDALKAGKMDKVVLSQCQFEKQEVQHVLLRYLHVCQTQNAYCYLLHLPNQTWVGASPELLLKTNYQTAESMALAGTRLMNQSESNWGDKEVSEQNIVGKYVLETFEALAFEDVKLNASFTKTAGGIQHICNTITGKAPATMDWLNTLQNLHPTPALAGYPKQKAISYIQQTEKFERTLYGGFMGIATDKELEVFVNIRSATLYQNGIRYIAGAGINKDSDPDKEWKETNHKMNVIKEALTI